jgi:threonine-phosphate decarboxylase
VRYAAVKETLNEGEPGSVAHGGRVYEAARRWGINPDQVIDFSANINPLGFPRGVLAAFETSLTPESLRAYPDPHAFVCALADKHSLRADGIIVGGGAAALIFAVLHAILPRRVGVLEPAFGEYSRACASVRAELIRSQLQEEDDFTPNFASLIRAIKERRFDLLIFNSPHNPTGNLYAGEDLLRLIEAAEANDVAVMLDEAFIDYAPQASLLSLAATKQRLVVLRSLTKLYAMPALRVGYGVCGTKLAAKVREQIDPWSVSTIALEAGRAALAEDAFCAESRRANAQAREEFADGLRRVGLQVFPSAANFLLARLPRGSGAGLESRLETERILIRRCDSFRGLGDAYIRLAVRSSGDNRRLVSLIETWLKQND